MKNQPILISICTLLLLTSCGGNGSVESGGPIIQSSIGIGSIIAIVASWTRNQSVLWAILHAFLGWLYVIYYVLTRK